MEVRFYVVQVNGEKVADMSKYADAIFDILTPLTDVSNEVIIGEAWFSLSKVPTLDEILTISRRLVKLGLVIEA